MGTMVKMYIPSEPYVLVTKTSETRVSVVYQQNWRLQDISQTFWKLNAKVFDVFNL